MESSLETEAARGNPFQGHTLYKRSVCPCYLGWCEIEGTVLHGPWNVALGQVILPLAPSPAPLPSLDSLYLRPKRLFSSLPWAQLLFLQTEGPASGPRSPPPGAESMISPSSGMCGLLVRAGCFLKKNAGQTTYT